MKSAQPQLADILRPLPPFDAPAQPHAARPVKVFKAALAILGLAIIAGCAGGHASTTPAAASKPGIQVPVNMTNIARALPAVSPTPIPADLVNCSGKGGNAGCHVTQNPNVPASKTPTAGLTAGQLRSAYGLPPAAGGAANGPLIAIVDAFDDPVAESDLGTYRSAFGLPSCTSRNGCFTKVVLTGAYQATVAALLTNDTVSLSTWGHEIPLDLAMASAGCPTCKILLVESGGQDLDSLANAVNIAAAYNPAAISVSWGVSEGGGNAPNIDPGAQAAFNHPGIPIVASAGDSGDVQFPASSPYVTSVGGTTLAKDGSARGWSETVWANTGDGCSIMFAAPAWQTASACGSGARSIPDVSMIADYNPGVAVYTTYDKGWVVLGGTSVGAPFVAGLYAAANDYGNAAVGAPGLASAALNAVAGSPATPGSPNGLAGF